MTVYLKLTQLYFNLKNKQLKPHIISFCALKMKVQRPHHYWIRKQMNIVESPFRKYHTWHFAHKL